jgi:hypothetical protein
MPPPTTTTAQPAPGDDEHDDGLPPLPASADAAWAAVTAAIEHVGSVDVPRWAGAVAECVGALERVAYAAPALAGRGKPPLPRAALPPGASAGEVERRWAGPLYGRDAVTVVGRGSVVGRELVGWVAADDSEGEEEGGAGGGRRWLSGVFPASARDIAARFTERVLRPSGQGWLHACVGAVVAGHASLLMDEDEVGEWEPLPEVPAYPLVSWGKGGGCCCMHVLACVAVVCACAGGGRRGCGVAVADARVGGRGGPVGQAGACGSGSAACGGASGSRGVAHGDRGGSDGGAGDAARAFTSTCTFTIVCACRRRGSVERRGGWWRGCSERRGACAGSCRGEGGWGEGGWGRGCGRWERRREALTGCKRCDIAVNPPPPSHCCCWRWAPVPRPSSCGSPSHTPPQQATATGRRRDQGAAAASSAATVGSWDLSAQHSLQTCAWQRGGAAA